MSLSAKQAVEKAFELFDEFVSSTGQGQLNHKLLEELKRDGNNWRVVVGFDMGRKKTSNAFSVGLGGETSPIREYRTFIIDAESGELVEMIS